jgi:hypothetical protein
VLVKEGMPEVIDEMVMAEKEGGEEGVRVDIRYGFQEAFDEGMGSGEEGGIKEVMVKSREKSICEIKEETRLS